MSLTLLKLPVEHVESCGLMVVIEFEGQTYISNVERLCTFFSGQVCYLHNVRHQAMFEERQQDRIKIGA